MCQLAAAVVAVLSALVAAGCPSLTCPESLLVGEKQLHPPLLEQVPDFRAQGIHLLAARSTVWCTVLSPFHLLCRSISLPTIT